MGDQPTLTPSDAAVLPMSSIEAAAASVRLASGLVSEPKACAADLLRHEATKSQSHDAQLLLQLGQTTRC